MEATNPNAFHVWTTSIAKVKASLELRLHLARQSLKDTLGKIFLATHSFRDTLGKTGWRDTFGKTLREKHCLRFLDRHSWPTTGKIQTPDTLGKTLLERPSWKDTLGKTVLRETLGKALLARQSMRDSWKDTP